MRVLGIDPGLRCTGYGIIDFTGRNSRVIQFGTIRTDAKNEFSRRIQTVYDDISDVIQEYTPDEFAIEEAFYSKNAKTALQLGHVRGVAMLAAMHASLPVTEYSAKKIKMAITGRGGATKEQVQFMVKNMLKLDEPPTPLDASDALACALCHQQQLQLSL
ncbi:MAG: crossover junction endodeoxyribonuclease RuvC [Candidatus Marinimicrobia bacterium]|nr:crossover junction endodeoxyribonuclease RuvC [Candidatus Neomarinimicrobiota bacterium]MCF7827447.1 crossover junction endodeoxyribonuclease RuvC [Candidatus Neomarinimicrobiota bacterium]MCF7882322.1 crossover junction endodeoxyribonuclease RuvC [Candidatus Neomarinimicrobiota bacterium]